MSLYNSSKLQDRFCALFEQFKTLSKGTLKSVYKVAIKINL